MAEKSPPKTETKDVLTIADAAQWVGRKPEDCLAFKDYGDTVIVVTTSGAKLQADKATGAVVDLLDSQND